ncbi:hypothetical protein EIN_096190 [Entamoeba invadens IP1]|uniref:Uncharacterized protein n=1 Tax=Entamoeba invadens IP1 TaxID=370355 RepID=A0A0A1U0F7_ENTIV|nr:hypothetical protein EIN_096190 [Entamoeba invadens IP1]ELP87362.1 hypothetical protein EIN_096190 [Entamoeba invadens IP1]|eukprot:XP_004254133.1 hypothetical protein EIN_096190 [Entamoeba invadens IP1]
MNTRGSTTIEERSLPSIPTSMVEQEDEFQKGLSDWIRELSDKDGRLHNSLRTSDTLREPTGMPITYHAKKVSFKRSGVVGVNLGRVKRMFVSLKEASRLLHEAGNVFTSEMIEYFTVPEVDRFLVTIQMETLPWVVPRQVIQAETDVIPAQRSQQITADRSMNSITDNENVLSTQRGQTCVHLNSISSSEFLLRMNNYIYCI